MRILYDSKNEYYKAPFGCLREDERCTLRIDIPAKCNTTLVRVIIKDEECFEMLVPFVKEKTENGYDTFKTEFSLFNRGLYFYYFNIRTQEGEFDLYKVEDGTNMNAGDVWQLTCFDKNYDTPEGFKGQVMYQIFPDRFNKAGDVTVKGKLEPYYIHENMGDTPVFLPDENGEILNNDFYGGNLKGITEKLQYLKELGVGIIYLNPIFFAYSNHRYDTADYKRIDPLLGDEADFEKLCKKAHNMGMKIILDGVFSHTGNNSIYFDAKHIFGNGACSNEQSPYRDWYMFEEYPDRYTSWWGIKTLPCVDELNPTYMDYIINSKDSVIEHWLSLGADGFRLDVADELPDDFIKALKVRLKEIKPDAILIGEVWEDASNKISYGIRRKYFSQSELDSVMNYPFRDAILNFVKGYTDGRALGGTIMTIAENYPKPVLDCLMNLLSTHDTPRVLTEISGAGEGMTKSEKAEFDLSGDALLYASGLAKAAVFLQFVLPGNPCIYYGDEIGMQGFEDPLNRAFFRWSEVDSDMYDFYKEMAALKNGSRELRLGDVRVVSCGERYIKLARIYDGETVYAELSLDGAQPKQKSAIYELAEGNVCMSLYK